MSYTETSQVKELREHLNKKIKNSSTFKIEVHRSNILEDSFQQFHNSNPTDYLNQLEVHFIDENQESGEALIKEWINLLIDEFLNPSKNFFVHSENFKYYPSTKSGIDKDCLDYFRFSGLIFALSIIYNASVQITFSTFFLKHILHIPLILEDLKDYDILIFNSFEHLQKDDIEKLDFYFETNVDGPKGREAVELIPNGSNIKVTNENKNDYFAKMVDFLLSKSILKQTESFCEGFESLIPHKDIDNVTPEELNQLFFGTFQVDFEDLKKRVRIAQPDSLETPTIKYFFGAISKWNNEDLMKLFMFITGVSSLPKKGEVFNIRLVKCDKNLLPTAHTVMRTIDLPEYQSEEELNKKLLTVIHICELMNE